MAKLDAPDSPFAAIILAKAGMVRPCWDSRITCDLGPPNALHAVLSRESSPYCPMVPAS